MSDTEKTINVSGNAIWSNGVPITADSLNNIEARLNATGSYKEKIFITLFDTETTIKFNQPKNLELKRGLNKYNIHLLDLSIAISNLNHYYIQHAKMFEQGPLIEQNIETQLASYCVTVPYIDYDGDVREADGNIYIKDNKIYAKCNFYGSSYSTTIERQIDQITIKAPAIPLLLIPKSLTVQNTINEPNITIDVEKGV